MAQTGSEVSFISDAELTRCRIVLKVASVSIRHATFIDCTIEAKRQLSNREFYGNRFVRCTFKGRYHGCGFGDSPELYGPGELVDADFSAAELYGCRFLNVDVSRIHFPRWPCFTIVDPANAGALREQPWPDSRYEVLVDITLTPARGTVAVSWHAPTLVKKMGGTEEELRRLLEPLPFVIL
ncbi:MAG TPA: hypothetical protein VGF69_05165 [Thermoanaerobaculia bacterium]